MSTLTVNTIQKIGGGRHSRVSYSTTNTNLLSGITWSSAYDNTTQTIGNISGGTSSDIFGLIFGITYTHNGSTNHGYLNGWYFQTGKSYTTGIYVNQSHYDWYYNVSDWSYVIPWDPAGTQSLSIFVTYAYNSSSANTYAISTKGFLSQQT